MVLDLMIDDFFWVWKGGRGWSLYRLYIGIIHVHIIVGFIWRIQFKKQKNAVCSRICKTINNTNKNVIDYNKWRTSCAAKVNCKSINLGQLIFLHDVCWAIYFLQNMHDQIFSLAHMTCTTLIMAIWTYNMRYLYGIYSLHDLHDQYE